MQINSPFAGGFPQPGGPGVYSVEFVGLNSLMLCFHLTVKIKLLHFYLHHLCVFCMFYQASIHVWCWCSWNKSRTSKSFLTCMLDVLNYDNNCFYFLLILFQQTFPQYGFIKYSIPQPPGRQSVEVVCADLLLFILCVAYSATINIFVVLWFYVCSSTLMTSLRTR